MEKAKRSKETITIGSAYAYLIEATDTIPEVDTICVETNLLGYIKSGAALEYTEETYEEKDDYGHVSKVITTSEEAVVKMGLITWNGETLEKLVDRSKVEEKENRRVTKIGGFGNAKGKYYVLCLHHVDKVDGDIWILLVGRNTAGISISFAMDSGSLIEPEFKAIPQDRDGTLIQFIEEIDTAE